MLMYFSGVSKVVESCVEDEINVPIALSTFRDKGSRLWSLKKKEEEIIKIKLS